jgi:rod shape determining protein RodA
MKGFRGFCAAALAAGVPAVLILAEPDLGTTLALVPAVVAMMLVASVWRTGLLALLGVGMVAAALLLGVVHEAERPGQSPERRERILKCVPLRPHQVKRVKTFLYPETDPMGSGYNLRQSLIAIGSGGLRGKGFGHGETNRLKFLPQSVSMNDFIFCVYGEETGFVGTMALVSLFGVLCLSGVWSAFRAGDLTGRLLAIGVSTLVFAHTYINIAMSIGLVPITGLPLPFISSGRTFLLVVMSGLGLIQSVNLHREEKERQ